MVHRKNNYPKISKIKTSALVKVVNMASFFAHFRRFSCQNLPAEAHVEAAITHF